MPDVIHTPQARSNLKEIARYIAEQSGDRETARRQLRKFRQKSRQYARSPELGERCEEFGARIRSFRVGSYSALYRPITGGILILLVVHSSRDIVAVFREAFGIDP